MTLHLAVVCRAVVCGIALLALGACNTHLKHSPTYLSGTLPTYAGIAAPVGLVVRPETRAQTFSANPYLGYAATIQTGAMIEQSIDAAVRPLFDGSRIVADPSEAPLAIEVTYTDIVYDQPGLLGLQFEVETLLEFYRNGTSIASQRSRTGKFPFSNQGISYEELDRRISASLSNATGASITSGLQTLLGDPGVRQALSDYASASEVRNLAGFLNQATQAYASNQSGLASGADAANTSFMQQLIGAVGGAASGAGATTAPSVSGGGGQCDAQTIQQLRTFIAQRCQPGSRDHSCGEHEQLLQACGG
jgi:hypothetical protein